jgi:predicted nucleic acid-binding protein
MNGAELVVDTNILIYLTSGNPDIAKLVRGKQIAISVITEMEVRSWPALSKADNAILDKMLSQFRIVQLHDDLKNAAIEIRRSTKLKLPDSIIGATAIFLDTPLLTADQAFKKVDGLDLILLSA